MVQGGGAKIPFGVESVATGPERDPRVDGWHGFTGIQPQEPVAAPPVSKIEEINRRSDVPY